MAVTKVSDLASLFNTIYADSIFVAREMNIMTALVTPYSATGWMNRVIPERAQVTAVAVADGVDYAAPTTFSKSTAATLTPGEIIAQVILTDQDVETDPENAKRDAATEMGGAIATKIDTDLVTDMASFTASKGPGAGTSATLAKFAVCMAVLRNAKAPAPLYVVLHPYHWHDVWVELGQPGANQALLGDLANEALRAYFVGRFISAQWFVSANIAVDASDDAVSGVFHPQALAFDSRKAPVLEPERDASLRAWELNFTAGYAHGVRRQAFGVKYIADATEPS